MATVIDSLLITLGVDPSGVNQGMQSAESTISSSLGAIMAVVGPFLAAVGVSALSDKFIEGASSVKKYSDMLNMSMEDLQAWRGAAMAMGGEAESIDEMLIDMTEHLSDMVHNGSGPAQEVLTKLGISATDATGKIRPAADVLLDLAEAGEKVGSAQMLAYGKIFGFDKQVIDLLQKGKSGLLDLLKAQKELAVYSKEDAEIAKQAKIAKHGFHNALESLNAFIMRAIVPGMTVMTGVFTKFVTFVRQNHVFVLTFLGAIATLLVARLIPASRRFAAVWLANPLTWIILAIIAAVAVLALLVDDLWAYMEGGKSALADFWAIFGTGEEVTAALAKAWEALKAIGSRLFAELKGLVTDFFAAFATVGEGLKNIFMGLANFLVGLFTGNWKQLGDGLMQVFTGVLQALLGLFTGFFDFLWRRIKAMFNFVGDGIKGVANFFGIGGDDEKEEKDDGKFKGVKDPFDFGDDDEAPQVAPKADMKAFSDALGYGDMSGYGSPATSNTTSTVNNSSSTNIQNLTVQTQATDANGIAGGIGGALASTQDRYLVAASQSGTVQK